VTQSHPDNGTPSAEQVVEALLAASDALLSLAARAAANADPALTPPQHLVLTTLATRGPHALADLAAELSVEPAVVALVCGQLERKQLLHRDAGASRAGCDERLALTEGGLRIVTAITEEVHRWLQDRLLGAYCRGLGGTEPVRADVRAAPDRADPRRPPSRDEHCGQRHREDRPK
jgi:DNA-binding MarR family transcriptional regulator